MVAIVVKAAVEAFRTLLHFLIGYMETNDGSVETTDFIENKVF